jgi:hypothetical protein
MFKKLYRPNLNFKNNLSINDNWAISDLTGFKYLTSEMVYGFPPQQKLLMHRSERKKYNDQYILRPTFDNLNVKVSRPRSDIENN